MLDTFGKDRRALMQSALGAGFLLSGAACASAQPVREAQGLRLSPRPTRVFKSVDLPREGTEAWFLVLLMESDREIEARVTEMTLSYFAGANEVKTERHLPAAFEAMAMRGLPASGRVFRPLAVRLICRERAALGIDRMRCSIALADASVVSADIALNTYTQQTQLIFPFQGPGIVTQAGAANGGHRNASGAFATDAMALSPNYAVQTGTAFAVNTDLAGYGHALVAPAAGRVVHARGDRPDQPVPGESNPDFQLPEFGGAGDPGNHIVIDHGNGEFSLVAHMMAGSLAVAEGQTVQQGQSIGRLGNSGDSFAPHVHHHLQDGPDIQASNGLPCRYSNIAAQRLDRGEFFNAR